VTRQALTVELTVWTPAVGRAVAYLMQDRRLALSFRVVRKGLKFPEGRVLRIERGSLVRPVLTVLWGRDELAGSVQRDIALALNPVVWSDHSEVEHWRLLGRPLPDHRCLGTPDPSRPWVLVAPGIRANPRAIETATGLHDPQLHFLGAGQVLSRGAVRWLATRNTVASLLGHADAVFTPEGPLAWDAARAGVPVAISPGRHSVPAELAQRRLSRTVPALLSGDRTFWVTLATSLLEGDALAPWGTADWLRQAHERRPAIPSQPRWKLKLLKLRRDPRAFWADSWLVRELRGVKQSP
jgi:hypothetical protein